MYTYTYTWGAVVYASALFSKSRESLSVATFALWHG